MSIAHTEFLDRLEALTEQACRLRKDGFIVEALLKEKERDRLLADAESLGCLEDAEERIMETEERVLYS